MSTSVHGVLSNQAQVNNAVERLRLAGFSDADISLLGSDAGNVRDLKLETNSKAPEGATIGTTTGGALGAVGGWLIGVGSLAIPGVGPFIAAGPILAALSGAAVGAGVGGLTGALVGMGMTELEARQYEGRIRDGQLLLSVHAETSDQVSAARQALEQAGAVDIATSSEAAVPRS
ncbi:hypothetical protein DB346_02735 [Verrucomicrobia bacterium LW23]|nr:hypothetical protein DB346_03920 [Verrucomicrobia bacterium LW23]PTY04364.1 hypothetical protein DB346_02735 [Verrucomicrobia bacterium LW23]